MRSPVPSIADDQLDDAAVVRHAEQFLIAVHDRYAVQIHAKRQSKIEELEALLGDLLNIIETGIPNYAATARARVITCGRCL